MEENTTSNAPAVEAAPQAAEPSHQTESAPKEGSVGLKVDERTGQRQIVDLSPKPQPQEGPQEPQEGPKEPVPTVFPKEEPPKPYTPSEMTLAMQMGQVDESRIPAEVMPQYMAMKMKDAPPPKTNEEVRQEFLAKVTANVKEETMKEIGLTEDELAMGEYSDDEEIRDKVEQYKTALEINRRKAIDTVYDKIRAQQQADKETQEFQSGIKTWIDQQRAQEPHFDEIGQFMTNYYKSMKYEDARVVAPAIEAALAGKLTPQYAGIIQKYYEGCRKEYYARLNGTSTTPTPRTPRVETKGGGKDVNNSEDFGKMLREASPRDKSRVLSAWMASMRG